jgi:hypothetical protein
MKQYRIRIDYVPRSSLDRYPWTWTVVDENYKDIEGNRRVMVIDREKTFKKAKRMAERHARRLLKEYNRAGKSKSESYLYPKPSMMMGPR